jgi:hypothetical protein
MRAATRERTIRESTIRLGRDAVAEGWRGTRRFIQALRNMVARDGVEPPTPAFSGLDSRVFTMTWNARTTP